MSSVRGSVKELLQASQDNHRNFVETIELQIGLKNYDPQRDKRFSGTIKLPNLPRPRMTVCLLGDQNDIDRAKVLIQEQPDTVKLDSMTADDLKK